MAFIHCCFGYNLNRLPFKKKEKRKKKGVMSCCSKLIYIHFSL